MCECGIVSNPYSKNIKRGHLRGVAPNYSRTLPPPTLSTKRIAYATQVKHASANFVLRWALLDWLRYGKQEQMRGFPGRKETTTQPETLKGISWCLVSILALSKNETRVERRFDF